MVGSRGVGRVGWCGSALVLAACGGAVERSGDPAGSDVATVTVDGGPDSPTTDPFADVSFTATGAVGAECALDDGAWVPCVSPVQLPWLGDQGLYEPLSVGEHTLQVRAIAPDGEVGATDSYSWEVASIFAADSVDFALERLIDGQVLPLDVVEANAGWKGIFRINCEFDHAAYDDPIVFPGEPDRAHLHLFWGAKDVDANTTFDSLFRSPEAGCSGGVLNRSAYWFPSVLAPSYDAQGQRLLDAAGEPAWEVVLPKVGEGEEGSREATDAHEVFYYSAAVDDLQSIQAPPLGLRIIAGDATTGPGEAQSASVARWHCQSWQSTDEAGGPWSATIPECAITTGPDGMPVGDVVRFDVFFPSCWNGADLDSEDHKSHMAYPEVTGGPDGTRCPETHPVPLARVSFHYAFPVLPAQADPVTASSRGWRLASDGYSVSDSNGGLSLHGDWFNGWHPEAMDALVERCVRGARDCHDGNLAWVGGDWQDSVSLGRLIDAKGTQVIPEILDEGRGTGHGP